MIHRSDHFAPVRTVDPAVEPVSLTEVKQHSRVDLSDMDVELQRLIVGARQHVEETTGRSLITQTWEYTLDRLPELIKLPRGPVQSVTSIEYVDLNGVTQTVDSSIYRVDTKSRRARITEAHNQSWPSVRDVTGAVTITYVAGYGSTAESVPQPIRHAIMMLVAHWVENKEAVLLGVTQAPMILSVESLLAPYRERSF